MIRFVGIALGSFIFYCLLGLVILAVTSIDWVATLLGWLLIVGIIATLAKAGWIGLKHI